MGKTRVAINGFGRIGRAFMRLAHEDNHIEVVAINDLGSVENLAYLLKHDTVYKDASFAVEAVGKNLVLEGKKIPVTAEADPAKLPWKEMRVDVVVESSGFFTTYEKARAHVTAGAKRVVITAPAKDDQGGETILMGVNEDKFATCEISSNASCTTNAASPLIAILDEGLGVEKALLNTAHAMTNSQPSVDSPNKHDLREGRAASQNIIPTSTGAAIAVTKAFTKLEHLFDGIAMRVPVICGSLVDVTFVAKRHTTVEEVNDILRTAAKDKRWEGIFTVSEDELVSSDIIGSLYGAIADLALTRVVGGNLVQAIAWYDNEMGYANTLLRHVREAGKHV